MGNRAKRVEAARLLKARGLPTKLYRGHKLLAYKHLKNCREEISKLQYGVGDIVNDCDARNHRITGYAWSEQYPVFGHLFQKCVGSNWTGGPDVRGYVFEHPQYRFTYPSGDRFSCGCPAAACPPITREEYEKYWLDRGLMRWKREMLDLDQKDEYEPEWTELDDEILAALQKGDHIVDEEGIWLPEWEARRDELWMKRNGLAL